MRNPFVKIIVLSTPQKEIWVRVPWIGKIKHKVLKRKRIRGRKIDYIVIDEAGKI